MNNPLFIHTYWSKPALNNRWDVEKVFQIINNIWYYTTSVAYLKKLGQQIELHTDDFGLKCMDHIPYDKIHLTLNTIPSNIEPYIWAFGKFWALKDCPLNTIHIDGDVFIKSYTKNPLVSPFESPLEWALCIKNSFDVVGEKPFLLLPSSVQ